MSGDNYCYIGPTVARMGLKKTTLVIGAEPPPQLKSLIELKPMLGVLFVPTGKIAIARKNMERRGTIENSAAEEIIKMAREKMAEERKIRKD